MPLTSKEKSQAFKARMYAKGYAQMQVWVLKRHTVKDGRTDLSHFIRKLDKMTAGCSRKKRSELYEGLLKVAERKRRKEEKGET